MTRADVVVVVSMNQQDGNSRSLHCVQWAGLKQVDTIAQPRVNTGRRNHRPAQRPAEPGFEMKRAGDALVTHLARRRKWAFYDDRAVSWLRGKRLQHQGSPVRLTEAIDTSRRIVLVNPVDPAVQVVGLLHAVGGEQAAALTMGARVRQQDSIAMVQKQLPVAGYAFAIVGNAMQRDHDAAVEVPGMNVPALQLDSVRGSDADLLKARVIALAGHRNSLLAVPQSTVDQLDTGFADHYPGQDSEKNIDANCDQQQLEQLTHDCDYVAEYRKFHLRKRA